MGSWTRGRPSFDTFPASAYHRVASIAPPSTPPLQAASPPQLEIACNRETHRARCDSALLPARLPRKPMPITQALLTAAARLSSLDQRGTPKVLRMVHGLPMIVHVVNVRRVAPRFSLLALLAAGRLVALPLASGAVHVPVCEWERIGASFVPGARARCANMASIATRNWLTVLPRLSPSPRGSFPSIRPLLPSCRSLLPWSAA